MTSPIDRAAEAPRILGQLMTWTDNGREACWETRFGSVFVWLYPAQPSYLWGRRFWVWHVGTPACQGSEHTDAGAIAPIERELLAIAAAIPTRPACASCGGRHTSTTDEETCFEARAAVPAPEGKP